MSNRQKTKNDIAWEKLFENCDILNRINSDGQFIISASQMRTYREPRLMAKFDHSVNLPYIFSVNNLAILPISRGDYIIAKCEAYKQFKPLNKTINHVRMPEHIQSLDPNSVSSETIAINCAFASGMLADFLGEGTLYPTVSGRMGSGQFDFSIQNLRKGSFSNVQVNNSQVEIDAAFEGIESLAILEAKCDLSEDFLIRQLYYPYRVWQDRISKKVRPIFLVYSNGIYSMYEYEFQDANVYNSLNLVKHKKYSIEDTSIEMTDLMEVASKISTFVPEPEISFPQADSFERVINLCELLDSQELSRDCITQKYAFDIRQTNYYTDAARYLGLVEKKQNGRKPFFSLSEHGRQVMQLRYKQRQLALCKCILEHEVFYKVFESCKCGCIPEEKIIVKIMRESNLYRIGSDNTFRRRASTVRGWINWMFGLIQE